jgi:cell division transport system permease protein
MQLRYVWSELGQGLRRNVSMHVAVILTLFVSMTLVGLGVLLNQQRSIATEYLGNQLEIATYLCRDSDVNPSCTSAATDTQKEAIEAVIEDSPEVEDYRFETKEEAFEKVKKLLGEDQFEGPNPVMTADDMSEAYWITLKNPKKYEGITSAVIGLDGVSQIRDERETVKPLFDSLDTLKYASWGVAGFLLLAALLLVANTIRLAAFARRKEIGIMRLVGASTLYIALPFLLEALVTAVVGVALAAGALGAVMWFGVEQRISQTLSFMPWIGLPDFTTALIVIAVLGPLLTLLPTLALTRKYLKV